MIIILTSNLINSWYHYVNSLVLIEYITSPDRKTSNWFLKHVALTWDGMLMKGESIKKTHVVQIGNVSKVLVVMICIEEYNVDRNNKYKVNDLKYNHINKKNFEK